jgi:hypothetical protein
MRASATWSKLISTIAGRTNLLALALDATIEAAADQPVAVDGKQPARARSRQVPQFRSCHLKNDARLK